MFGPAWSAGKERNGPVFVPERKYRLVRKSFRAAAAGQTEVARAAFVLFRGTGAAGMPGLTLSLGSIRGIDKLSLRPTLDGPKRDN